MDERGFFRIAGTEAGRPGQLGIEPVTHWVCDTKSDPLNSCPYSGPNTTKCDQLNDGKLPLGPKRLNGIVAADCNYKCVTLCVCVCVCVCV